MKNNAVVVTSIILMGVAGFFGGMKYQESKSTRAFTQTGSGQFPRNGQRVQLGTGENLGRGGIRPVNGEIIAFDEKSITVKLQDGSSKIIIVSGKTQISEAQTVDKSNLKTGETISVFGTENKDGSVTAQNIQLNPRQMMLENSK